MNTIVVTKAILHVITHYTPIQFNIGGWLYNKLKVEIPNYSFSDEALLQIVNSLITIKEIPYYKVGEKTFVMNKYTYNPNGCAPYEKFDARPNVDVTKKFWLILGTNLSPFFSSNNEQEVMEEVKRLVDISGREYIIMSSDGRVSPALPPINYERY